MVVGLGSAWISRLDLLVMVPMNGSYWAQTFFLNGFAGGGSDGFEWV